MPELPELLRPMVEPLTKRYAAHKVQRLVGFWFCWHALGGFEALRAAGWARRTTYSQMEEFCEVFGVSVEDFMPEAVAALVAGGVLMRSAVVEVDSAQGAAAR